MPDDSTNQGYSVPLLPVSEATFAPFWAARMSTPENADDPEYVRLLPHPAVRMFYQTRYSYDIEPLVFVGYEKDPIDHDFFSRHALNRHSVNTRLGAPLWKALDTIYDRYPSIGEIRKDAEFLQVVPLLREYGNHMYVNLREIKKTGCGNPLGRGAGPFHLVKRFFYRIGGLPLVPNLLEDELFNAWLQGEWRVEVQQWRAHKDTA